MHWQLQMRVPRFSEALSRRIDPRIRKQPLHTTGKCPLPAAPRIALFWSTEGSTRGSESDRRHSTTAGWPSSAAAHSGMEVPALGSLANRLVVKRCRVDARVGEHNLHNLSATLLCSAGE